MNGKEETSNLKQELFLLLQWKPLIVINDIIIVQLM
jgi:hypothetical protein